MLLGQVLNQIADKCTRACGGVKYLHIFIGQCFVEMFLEQVFCAFNHEVHNFVGCVHYAQAIGSLWVISFIKILV